MLAHSVPIRHNIYKYHREYPEGPLFSNITGYDSLILGAGAGVEEQYDSYLNLHSQNHASSLSQFFSNLLNPPPPTTDNVTLTVQPYLQKVAQQALSSIPDANKDGAVVAIQPLHRGDRGDVLEPDV